MNKILTGISEEVLKWVATAEELGKHLHRTTECEMEWGTEVVVGEVASAIAV